MICLPCTICIGQPAARRLPDPPASLLSQAWRAFMEAGLAHALIAEFEGQAYRPCDSVPLRAQVLVFLRRIVQR